MILTDDSRLPGFYRMSIDERLALLVARGVLSGEDAKCLASGQRVLTRDTADKIIENVIGVFGMPFAIAPNFRVNGRDCLVPMVTEEPSIVAGVSGAAKLARECGGFTATLDESLLIGQVQVVRIGDPDAAIASLRACKDELLRLANVAQPNLLARGGGVRDIEFLRYRLPDERWTIVLHLLVDTCDAMGANLVNTICEAIATRVESICGGKVVLRILSNLADRSLVTAQVKLPLSQLASDGYPGEQVRDSIVLATALAETDPYRAATHNKGIMNGVDAVAIATGNDWRAIEAGAHAYAASTGSYRSLSRWSVADDGGLHGELRMPLKVGTAGGALTTNPGAALGLEIAGAATARDLGCLMGAVGLAQNFAALRALVTDGIQRGHMSLHARSVAAGAGARPEHFEQVVRGLIRSGDIKSRKASELIAALEAGSSQANREAPAAGAAIGTAFGKVILLGEHAVVYDRHALALPLARAVTAEVVETADSTRINMPDWNFVQNVEPSNPADGAASVLALIMRHLDVGNRHFDVRIRARIPAAMGLGASAALAVAIIRAFDRLLGLNLDNRAVDRLAFECEKLAHGTPSGIDNNLAVYGEPVLYTRSTATRTKPIRLVETPPVVIASSGERGITRDQVAGVRTRYDKNRTLYDTIFAEIDELSIAGAVALREQDYETLGAMMNVCHGFLNAIEVSTPALEKMIGIARSAGAVGAKLTGAGGGGSIVALCPGTTESVTSALEKAGYPVIAMDGAE